jgi:hypothetical protein
MKVSNGEIYNCKAALEELVKVKLPVKASLQAAKFANKVSDKLRAIDKVRQGLVETYGTKNDKGQLSVTPESPKWEAFVKEFNELMEIEEEFVVEKIRIPEKVTGTCDACKHNMDVTLQIEPNILMALEKFIEVG